MKKLISFGLFILLLGSNNFSYSQTSDIKCKIKSKKIVVTKMQGQIKVELKNVSDSRYIIYGFNFLTNSCTRIKDYCSNEISVVSEIIIETDSGIQIPSIPVPITEVVTFEDVSNEILESSKLVQNTKIVLEPETRTKYLLNYDLSSFRLKPGEYNLFLVFGSGEKTINYVPEEIQKADEQKYDAKVFYGWFFSNKVKLIVK